jgi:hypothetical protein
VGFFLINLLMGNMDPNLHDRELPFPVMRVLRSPSRSLVSWGLFRKRAGSPSTAARITLLRCGHRTAQTTATESQRGVLGEGGYYAKRQKSYADGSLNIRVTFGPMLSDQCFPTYSYR